MNFSQAIELNAYVQQNKQEIQLACLPLVDMATQLTEKLGFKVSVNSCRQAFCKNGLPTKRQTKQARELEAYKSENQRLREVMLKLVTATNVPDWLREELLTEDVHEEIKAAIRAKTL